MKIRLSVGRSSLVSVSLNQSYAMSGLRPVNLRTDLAPLADLIELAFVDSMDSSGRAAIRELRSLSRIGPGLGLLMGLGDLAQEVELGFVWIEDGRLVGNTSVGQTRLPTGTVWVIANVAVHPDYRGRGIARRLMQASMDMIRRRSEGRAITAVLQVEEQNDIARHLYESLGFVAERTWTQWRRSNAARAPMPPKESSIYITQRRGSEWRAEYMLAQRVRPAERGGIGWLRPLHPRLFHHSLWGAVKDFFSLRSMERLIIRGEDDDLRAVMWLESAFGAGSVQLTLMVDPAYQGLYDDALISLAARRYSLRSTLSIEHPKDEAITNGVLRNYNFHPHRTVIHMRWQPN